MPPRKRFGQHFLCNPVFVTQIIEAISLKPDDYIVEIGPGEGALTIPMLKHGLQIKAIEIDRDLAAKLRTKEPESGQLQVFCEDVLRFDISSLSPTGDPLRIVGNLPYNISTPLLFHLLKFHSLIHDMHFMLQREVAHTLVARAGDSDYSRLSVLVACFFDTTILFDVPPEAFHPPPAVISSFVQMLPRADIAVSNLKQFDQVVKLAFSQRRKTLVNAISPLLDESSLCEIGIDPRARPDAVSPSEYLRMLEYLT